MSTEVETTKPKRRMKRKAAAIAAGIMSISGVAGASVLIQNFMSAEFTAGPPPCLIKTAGVDTGFDVSPTDKAFDFTLQTTTVQGVDLTNEHIVVNGITGDRVYATEVYRIENNCEDDLEVTLVDGAQTNTWADRRLEVWLGDTPAPTGYPLATNAGWDTTPLVFEDPAIGNATSGTVTVLAGTSVPVGMVVLTGDAATGTGDATWTVQAEWP